MIRVVRPRFNPYGFERRLRIAEDQAAAFRAWGFNALVSIGPDGICVVVRRKG